MELQIIWFILWGVLWAVYFMLDGFVLGSRILSGIIAKNDTDKTDPDQHHRPGLGRQRGLADHRRRRHLRGLPDDLRPRCSAISTRPCCFCCSP